MNRNFILRKIYLSILLCAGILYANLSAFAQAPYNIVMNIHGDPKTQMAFNWFTDIATTGQQIQISLGTGTFIPYKSVTVNNATPQNAHKAVFSGLTPNYTYSFRVGKTGAWSNIGTFTTAKKSKDEFSFIYTTDPQADNPTDFNIAKTTAYTAFDNHPDAKFWLACGDFVENGNDTTQWNQFFSTQQDLFLKVPFAPVRGNHDWSNNFSNHFNLEKTSFDSIFRSTYTYIYGDAQFFAINSERWDDGNNAILNAAYIDSLKQWMRAQVAAHPNITWRIVYYHKTIFTGGQTHQGEKMGRVWRDAMAPLFDELNIDIAFQGHNHVYEVIGPVYNKDTVARSVSNVTIVAIDTINKTNITGKSGGIFNVKKGTIYFLNSSNGYKQYLPNLLTNMPNSNVTGVPNYPSLFTGRLGHNRKPTYSYVIVSSSSIDITTYEVYKDNNGVIHHDELDKITVVKYCDPNTQSIVTYSSNQSFTNANLVIGNTLRITNNATVTFTNSTLRFYGNAKVIIEPGSKLVIDGGKLTADCEGKMWEGIIVLGNRVLPQMSPFQGTLELKNGVVIEHAICAVSAAPTGYYHNNGGIIKATDAIFRNNWRAVEYCSYENIKLPGYIRDNVGYFTRCTFIINDQNRFASVGRTFGHHVTMWKVRGVTFEGCTFDSGLSTRTGSGIYSIDAGYKIKNYCAPGGIPAGSDCACPPRYATDCIFNNLDMGINSDNTGEPYQTYLDQIKFANLSTGVYMKTQNNYRLTRCKFNDTRNYGFRSSNTSGYWIEENDFINKITPNTITHGIMMYYSGSAENRIYKNRFESVDRGIYVVGNNGGLLCFSSPGNPTVCSGLQFVRNTFTGVSRDIDLSSNTTVRPNQGSLSSGVDNKFTGTVLSSFYCSSTQQPINYYHSRSSSYIPFNPLSNVTVIGNAAIVSDANNFCDINTTDKSEITDSIEHYKMLQQQYDKLVAQLKENPELIHEILDLSDAMRELSDHAINRILGDSILYLDALKQWYEVVRTPIAKCLLAEVYAYEGKYDQAEIVLREIPEKIFFDELGLIEHVNYMQFYHFKKQMILSERDWRQLNEEEIVQLRHIAEATHGRSSSMAKGVLCFFFDICYEDEMEDNSPPLEGLGEAPLVGELKGVETTSDVQNQNTIYDLTLYPNPTESEMTVKTNNPAVKIVEMEIFDVFGKKIYQQTVNQSYGTLKLNELDKGMYILNVYLNQGDLIIKKVVKR